MACHRNPSVAVGDRIIEKYIRHAAGWLREEEISILIALYFGEGRFMHGSAFLLGHSVPLAAIVRDWKQIVRCAKFHTEQHAPKYVGETNVFYYTRQYIGCALYHVRGCSTTALKASIWCFITAALTVGTFVMRWFEYKDEHFNSNSSLTGTRIVDTARNPDLVIIRSHFGGLTSHVHYRCRALLKNISTKHDL